MEILSEVKIFLSPTALSERGISQFNFEAIRKSIHNLLQKRFPLCDVSVGFEQLEEIHIYFLNEQKQFVRVINKSSWEKAVVVVESVLRQWQQNQYLN